MTDILDRFTDAQFHHDWDQLRARVGDDAHPHLLERTHSQRRADALYAIFITAATTEPSTGATPEPLVNIVITQAVYDAALCAMETGSPFRPPTPGTSPYQPAGSEPFETTLGDTAGYCRTTTGTPIDPYDAVIASLTGHIRRVVIGSDGVIINLGRRRRCLTGSPRHAALLQAALDRNGRCLWPGCRHTHTQIDHTNPWDNHGPSDVANTGPACGPHNRLKTLGYTTWRDPHGHWHTTRPDGTHIQPV